MNSYAEITLDDSGKRVVTAAAETTVWDGKTVNIVISTTPPAGTPTAAYAANTVTLTANSTVNTTTANMVTAIDGLPDWECAESVGGEFYPGDAGVIVVTSGGSGRSASGGFIMSAGDELEIPVDMLSKIYVQTEVDDQVISWLAKGV